MNKLREKLRDFFEGRYGTDELGRFMIYLSFALLIVSFFVGRGILSTVALVLLVWTYIRMLSRDFAKRRMQNEKFLRLKGEVLGFFRGKTRAFQDRDHCYFKCPSCKKTLRVPRGKGNISIHCPRCHTDFIKRT